MSCLSLLGLREDSTEDGLGFDRLCVGYTWGEKIRGKRIWRLLSSTGSDLNLDMASSVPRFLSSEVHSLCRRCCRCNGTAKCLRCACVRNGVPCSHYHPGEAGNCHNTLPRGRWSSTSNCSSAPKSSQPAHDTSPTVPSAPLSSSPVLPSISTILQASIATLQHVPKGACDHWAKVLSGCLSSVVKYPADISGWSKIFMLAKCVLASPSAGHRLRWREIL